MWQENELGYWPDALYPADAKEGELLGIYSEYFNSVGESTYGRLSTSPFLSFRPEFTSSSILRFAFPSSLPRTSLLCIYHGTTRAQRPFLQHPIPGNQFWALPFFLFWSVSYCGAANYTVSRARAVVVWPVD